MGQVPLPCPLPFQRGSPQRGGVLGHPEVLGSDLPARPHLERAHPSQQAPRHLLAAPTLSPRLLQAPEGLHHAHQVPVRPSARPERPAGSACSVALAVQGEAHLGARQQPHSAAPPSRLALPER